MKLKKDNHVAPSVQVLEEEWKERNVEDKIETMFSIRQKVLV